MGTYRVEWECCDSVTETSCWQPETCPFCTSAGVDIKKKAEEIRQACENGASTSDVVQMLAELIK